MRRSKKQAEKQRKLLIQAISVVGTLVFVLLLSQTAFAKTTYVINDGSRVITYESFTTNPATVLTEAGLELDEHDTFTTEGGFGTTTLTVRRSQTISIDYCGDQITAETYGETVEELLARLNIYLQEEDTLSVSPDTLTADGMELTISRVLQQEQTFTAAIPSGISYCQDDSLPEGTEKILVEGREGELLCTANVTYVNGVETSREVTSQVVTMEPVETVIARGTGLNARSIPESEEPGLIIGDGTITLSTGEVLTYTHSSQVRATAYSHLDPGCDMITATGTTVHMGTVAVDPRYIPYGTRMFIVSNDGAYEYGIAVAEDCGGAIKGDRVDLYFPTYEACMAFGRRDCTIYFLG